MPSMFWTINEIAASRDSESEEGKEKPKCKCEASNVVVNIETNNQYDSGTCFLSFKPVLLSYVKPYELRQPRTEV